MSFKEKIERAKCWFAAPVDRKHFARMLALLFVSAVLIRLLTALAVLQNWELSLRPDSLGYLMPARALAAGDGFTSAPGSGMPEAVRPIGYPALLALGMHVWGDRMGYHVFLNVFLSSLAAAIVALLGRRCGSSRGGLLAGWLMALNLTSVATAPLMLADTLLAFLAACQFYFGFLAFKNGRKSDFAFFALFAATACYVKPVNLPVVLCGVPVLALAAAHSFKQFAVLFGIGVGLGALVVTPLLAYNYRVTGTWDGNTPNAYFHNGSAILAFATGESSDLWRDLLRWRAEAEFAEHPEQYATVQARNAWKKREFAAIVRRYPVATFVTHLPQAANLIPDAPTLLENNRVTSTGRGTMAVLRQQGAIAAVNHYLSGQWRLLLALIPFFLVWGATLLAAICRFAGYVVNRRWRELLAFGVFAFYYWWAPGPVISPRYLLPALPMIAMMAAWYLAGGNGDLRKKRPLNAPTAPTEASGVDSVLPNVDFSIFNERSL